MKIKIISGLILISIVLIICLWSQNMIKSSSTTEKDAYRFAQEYELEDKDNLFVYKTSAEIINILEKGTGVVYLGFPECKWCKYYVKYLNEVAKAQTVKTIYYYNITIDRKNNSPFYQQLVSLLNDYLQYDQEGNKRIFVPTVIGVKNGKIVGFNDETAWDTKGLKEPSDYWTEKQVSLLKNNLKTIFLAAQTPFCTEGCN